MSKQTEALKLALEGLEKWHFDKDPRGAADYIAAIHDALAENAPKEGEQMKNNAAMEDHWSNNPRFKEALSEQPAQQLTDEKGRPLKFWGGKAEPAQPSKPWVGLTDEERDAILDREFKQWWSRHDAVCRAIEAKLREKNT